MGLAITAGTLALGTSGLAEDKAGLSGAGASKSGPITAPLKALASNPNYFADGNGKAVYLTGSHTWNDFQDWGTDGSPEPIDFEAYVKMLVRHNHNFTLLWQSELPKLTGLPATSNSPPVWSVTPMPWPRTGPGHASDGERRFDLTKYNPTYFERLRARVRQLNAAGIYAGVYFFSGEFLYRFRSPTDGYPLSGENNVNGIDGGAGTEAETMTATNSVTRIQDALVRKIIDTLNDLPNVLWIVSQEAPPNSTWWNAHLIALARAYEAGKPFQHPIGYGVLGDCSAASDWILLNSDADWIAPAARISPPISRGGGRPARKVNINDSDHSYFGIWNDSAQVNRNYFWINFTQGNQTLFMDPYCLYYPRENRNFPRSVKHGIGSQPDPRWENARWTMGYIRQYAQRMNLAAAASQPGLSSTGHALVSTGMAGVAILVYSPSGGSFRVDLSGQPGPLAVEWMNPATGFQIAAGSVSGGAERAFHAPFGGDAVLFLKGSY